jgi:hypothetical protein
MRTPDSLAAREANGVARWAIMQWSLARINTASGARSFDRSVARAHRRFRRNQAPGSSPSAGGQRPRFCSSQRVTLPSCYCIRHVYSPWAWITRIANRLQPRAWRGRAGVPHGRAEQYATRELPPALFRLRACAAAPQPSGPRHKLLGPHVLTAYARTAITAPLTLCVANTHGSPLHAYLDMTLSL